MYLAVQAYFQNTQKGFQFSECLFQTCIIINIEEIFLYKALKIERKMSAKQKHRLKLMYKGGGRPKARPHRFTNLGKW